jgi:hypothetical protein
MTGSGWKILDQRLLLSDRFRRHLPRHVPSLSRRRLLVDNVLQGDTSTTVSVAVAAGAERAA